MTRYLPFIGAALMVLAVIAAMLTIVLFFASL